SSQWLITLESSILTSGGSATGFVGRGFVNSALSESTTQKGKCVEPQISLCDRARSVDNIRSRECYSSLGVHDFPTFGWTDCGRRLSVSQRYTSFRKAGHRSTRRRDRSSPTCRQGPPE